MPLRLGFGLALLCLAAPLRAQSAPPRGSAPTTLPTVRSVRTPGRPVALRNLPRAPAPLTAQRRLQLTDNKPGTFHARLTPRVGMSGSSFIQYAGVREGSSREEGEAIPFFVFHPRTNPTSPDAGLTLFVVPATDGQPFFVDCAVYGEGTFYAGDAEGDTVTLHPEGGHITFLLQAFRIVPSPQSPARLGLWSNQLWRFYACELYAL